MFLTTDTGLQALSFAGRERLRERVQQVVARAGPGALERGGRGRREARLAMQCLQNATRDINVS
jgi:hypothetical protein